MAAVSFSYAQALRVIGQKLVGFNANSFEVVKWNDDYIVWINRDESSRQGLMKGALFRRITETIFGHADLNREALRRIYFTQRDIWTADLEQRSNRNLNSPKDVRDMAFILRVVGDYLDRNQAKEFTILCAQDSVTVRYDQKAELLNVQNLYDFGIRMYLRRSERHHMN